MIKRRFLIANVPASKRTERRGRFPARYALRGIGLGTAGCRHSPSRRKRHRWHLEVQQTGQQGSARREHSHNYEYSHMRDNFVLYTWIHHYSSAPTFTEVPLRKMTLMSRYRRSVGNLALTQDGGKAVWKDDAHEWCALGAEQQPDISKSSATDERSAVTYLLLQLVWNTVEVVQYIFTNKQYTEQHNETEYTEKNIYNNKNT